MPGTFKHVSVRPGAAILRVGQTHVSRLADLPLQVTGAHRVWLQSSNPLDPDPLLSEETHLCMRMWLDLLHVIFLSTPFSALLFCPAKLLPTPAQTPTP